MCKKFVELCTRYVYEFADGLVSVDEAKMRDKIKRKPSFKNFWQAVEKRV